MQPAVANGEPTSAGAVLRRRWSGPWLRHTLRTSRFGPATSIAIGITVGVIVGSVFIGMLWLVRNTIKPTWPAFAQGELSINEPARARPATGSTRAATAAPSDQRRSTGSPALDAALQARTAFQRDHALYTLAARTTATQTEALLRALGKRTGPNTDSARAVLLQRLTDLDASRALALLRELDATIPGGTEAHIAQLFSTWGRRAFDSALAELALLEGNERTYAADALLNVALERGDDLDTLLARMPEGVQLQRLRAAAAQRLALADPAAAWQRAHSEHDTQAMRSVLRVWSRVDAVSAMAVAESVSAQSLRTDLRDVVFNVWLSRDPTAALNAFLEAGLDRPGAPAFDSLMFKLGTDANANAIENILARVPAEHRAAALRGLLAGATASEPELAWQTLRRLQMPDDVRARGRLNALRPLAATRPTYAIALSNSISDSTERDALLQALSEDFIASAPETAMQFIMEIDDRSLREALRTAMDARRPGALATTTSPPRSQAATSERSR